MNIILEKRIKELNKKINFDLISITALLIIICGLLMYITFLETKINKCNIVFIDSENSIYG